MTCESHKCCMLLDIGKSTILILKYYIHQKYIQIIIYNYESIKQYIIENLKINRDNMYIITYQAHSYLPYNWEEWLVNYYHQELENVAIRKSQGLQVMRY